MENIIEALSSFFIVMGIVTTVLLVVGFLLKAKGVTFVEFFPKKEEIKPAQVIYNNVISQASNVNPYGIDARKVAAIMAAIQHHNKKKG